MVDEPGTSEVEESEEPPYPSNFYAWYCVIVLLGVYLNSFLDRQILGLIVDPMKRTMGLSDTQVGFLMGPSFAIFYTFAGLPLGWLADRVSRRWLITAGQIFWSIASVTFGLGRNYTQMISARIGVGVGEASLSPSAYSMIADLFPPHRLARALSVYGIGIFVGGGLANFIGGQFAAVYPLEEMHLLPVVGERYGWQVIFFLIALPTVPLSLLLLTLREPIRRNLAMVRDSAGNLARRRVPVPEFVQYVSANRRTVLTHGLGFSCLAFSGYGASAWFPALMMRLHEWTPQQVGTYFGLTAMIFGPIGLFLGGYLGDLLATRGLRDSKMRVGLISCVAWLPFGLAAPLMPTGWLVFALNVPAVLISAMSWGVAPAAIQEIMPNQMRGQASAIYLLIINLIGLGLGPQVIALLTDYVFVDPLKVHFSLVCTTGAAHVLAIALLWPGLRSFRESRNYFDRWLAENSAVLRKS